MNVYIVQCNQYFKIGKADDIRTRLSGLQSGCPHELTLIATLKRKNAMIAEKQIHEYLKEYRTRGEWFLLSVEQVKTLIKKYKFVRTANPYQTTTNEEFKAKIAEKVNELRNEKEEWQKKYKEYVLQHMTINMKRLFDIKVSDSETDALIALSFDII